MPPNSTSLHDSSLDLGIDINSDTNARGLQINVDERREEIPAPVVLTPPSGGESFRLSITPEDFEDRISLAPNPADGGINIDSVHLESATASLDQLPPPLSSDSGCGAAEHNAAAATTARPRPPLRKQLPGAPSPPRHSAGPPPPSLEPLPVASLVPPTLPPPPLPPTEPFAGWGSEPDAAESDSSSVVSA